MITNLLSLGKKGNPDFIDRLRVFNAIKPLAKIATAFIGAVQIIVSLILNLLDNGSIQSIFGEHK